MDKLKEKPTEKETAQESTQKRRTLTERAMDRIRNHARKVAREVALYGTVGMVLFTGGYKTYVNQTGSRGSHDISMKLKTQHNSTEALALQAYNMMAKEPRATMLKDFDIDLKGGQAALVSVFKNIDNPSTGSIDAGLLPKDIAKRVKTPLTLVGISIYKDAASRDAAKKARAAGVDNGSNAPVSMDSGYVDRSGNFIRAQDIGK